MKKFNQLPFLPEAKNTHMTHLEDVVLYRGVDGVRDAINTLRAIRDSLAGISGMPQMSVKWDGAPSIVAGTDPTNGKFFVAKKSVFNKNPKVYYNKQDVVNDIPEGDLRNKMITAITYLPTLGIEGIVQGDLMFTHDSLEAEVIGGEKYITFHPNTILYAVPFDSDEGKRVRRAKIGVVWHTSYSGQSFEDMSANFKVSNQLNQNLPQVWSRTAAVPVAGGSISPGDIKEITGELSTAGKIFNTVPADLLNSVRDNRHIGVILETFHNSQVREGTLEENLDLYVERLQNFVELRFGKEIEKRKTEKGKQVQRDKLDEVLAYFQDKKGLTALFGLHRSLHRAKILIINKLNGLSQIGHFVKTRTGYRLTAPEGYVAVNKTGHAVKLVDRLEFSANNFSDDILKGWQR